MSCPNCGYCPHCGRGGRRFSPYVPYYPYYPYWQTSRYVNTRPGPNTTGGIFWGTTTDTVPRVEAAFVQGGAFKGVD